MEADSFFCYISATSETCFKRKCHQSKRKKNSSSSSVEARESRD